MECTVCHEGVHDEGTTDNEADPGDSGSDAAMPPMDTASPSGPGAGNGLIDATIGKLIEGAGRASDASRHLSFERQYLGWIILLGGLVIFTIVVWDSRRSLFPRKGKPFSTV